ncbi:MAG: phage tail tape measure protein [Pseudomonadota bacterium]
MNDDDPTRQIGDISDLRQAFGDLGRTASDTTASLSFDLRASTEEIRRMERETSSLSRSIGSGLRSAFDNAIFRGGKLSDVMRDLALSFSRTALNSALTPVQNALGGAVTGLFSGFAKGGAFSSGSVRAFAKGGVVGGPTTFPMRGGVGLMGEAGPEAIMPLTRGPDGSLGVKAQGGGGGGGVRVTINVSTPDVAGFRRSQGQIAAEIARAAKRGERNM